MSGTCKAHSVRHKLVRRQELCCTQADMAKRTARCQQLFAVETSSVLEGIGTLKLSAGQSLRAPYQIYCKH